MQILLRIYFIPLFPGFKSTTTKNALENEFPAKRSLVTDSWQIATWLHMYFCETCLEIEVLDPNVLVFTFEETCDDTSNTSSHGVKLRLRRKQRCPFLKKPLSSDKVFDEQCMVHESHHACLHTGC